MTHAVTVPLACAALVAVDLAARSWRLCTLTAMAGQAIRPLDAFRANVLADAGAVLSPMRVGGEPARVAALAAAGMGMPAIVAAIGWELATAWPTLIVMGTALMFVAAPDWFATVVPLLARHAASLQVALLGAVTLAIVALFAARRLRRRLRPLVQARLAEYVAPWRGCRRGALVTSVMLSAVNVAARTALLPALAMGLDAPPPAAALWVGSFVLVYGQLLLPTPAGLGVVELGFLGGAAGEWSGELGVLAAWRWWGTAVPAVLGVIVAYQLRRDLAGLLRPRYDSVGDPR